ncbi:hypothetical protein Tco_0746283, partial [Tanacetum coccineum]
MMLVYCLNAKTLLKPHDALSCESIQAHTALIYPLHPQLGSQGTVFGFPPYPFNYSTRRITIEEMLAKFIDKGKREHEEMEIFIKEFRPNNELLLKTRSNLLSDLKIEVNELSKVVSNVLIPKNEVKGVTTKGGKMTSKVTRGKEINETRNNKSEPPRFEQNVQEKPHNDGEKNKSSSIRERTTQPLVKPQQSSIPFPNRVRKEKEEALQRNFLENLKQLDINIPFIEALVQIPKYAKYLKRILTNKSRLEEACMETMNERCLAVLLNKLPFKKKTPGVSLTLVKYWRNIRKQKTWLHITYLGLRIRIWRLFPQIGPLKKGRGPICGHHSANITAKKVYESGLYWPSVFKDANEY